MPKSTPRKLAESIAKQVAEMDLHEKIATLNEVRGILHDVSPFKGEPVDFVRWVQSERVTANDYNPNVVAPPEMVLLEHSIAEDGYTQPIVAWHHDDVYEVVDGFHRNRVGRESDAVKSRIHAHLPLAVINDSTNERGARIASTIRHNRARGKHKVEAMSDIVVELKRRNWSTARICKELGMEEDEVLRLCQITGLSELFSDQEFSEAWDIEGAATADDIADELAPGFDLISDDVSQYEEEIAATRTVNTSDENRIFHRFTDWECYAAGFYATHVDGMSHDECKQAYADFLSDIPRFKAALKGVISEWKHSCEQYLTNVAMNRIAWLGQAAMCYAEGIPAIYRSGFGLLTDLEQAAANEAALDALNEWLVANDRAPVSMDEAVSGQRQSDIY